MSDSAYVTWWQQGDKLDVIGDLLRAGLLMQIGESEDRVAMVRAAKESLAGQLGSDLRPLVPYALVAAVDETTSTQTEPMRAADAALAAEWVTLRNVFPEPPAEILRAMLVAAVAAAAERDPNLLAAGWYSLRSAVELISASRWEAPLTNLARSWDDAVWDSVAETWSPVAASSTVRMPSVPKFEDKSIGIKSAAREQAQSFVDAGGWQQFASAMFTGYTEHVDSLLGATEVLAAASHRKSVEALRAFSRELGAKLRESLEAQERSIESMRLRSDLLWWQQTAFSPSCRVGYSELDPLEVPLIAALDLHLLMPDVAPLAAEHMLSELVANAGGKEKVTIKELAAAGVELPPGGGSTPPLVLDSIQTGAASVLLEPDRKFKAGHVAVLAFRELQARRLTLGTQSDGS